MLDIGQFKQLSARCLFSYRKTLLGSRHGKGRPDLLEEWSEHKPAKEKRFEMFSIPLQLLGLENFQLCYTVPAVNYALLCFETDLPIEANCRPRSYYS